MIRYDREGMTSDPIENLLKQTKEPLKPVKRSELLGGRRKSLDQIEYEEERELDEE